MVRATKNPTVYVLWDFYLTRNQHRYILLPPLITDQKRRRQWMIDLLINMDHETVVTLMIIADILTAVFIIHLIRKNFKAKSDNSKVIHG